MWFLAAVVAVAGVVYPGGMALALEPAPGVFLVAEPHLSDPRFQRSVVLLVEHGASGTVGLIVNKPTRTPLADALPPQEDLEPGERPLYFGGPVVLERLTFLVRSSSIPKRSTRVLDDVYWGGDAETLRQLLATGKKDGPDLRVYAGYSGWASGQLDAEIARGDWKLVSATAAAIFARDPDELWQELTGRPEGIPIRLRLPPQRPKILDMSDSASRGLECTGPPRASRR